MGNGESGNGGIGEWGNGEWGKALSWSQPISSTGKGDFTNYLSPLLPVPHSPDSPIPRSLFPSYQIQPFV